MKSNTKRLEKAKNPVLEEHPSVDGIFSSVWIYYAEVFGRREVELKGGMKVLTWSTSSAVPSTRESLR